MRVALVHDWLVSHRGGEKVLDALCELFPQADVFTLLHAEGSVSARIESHRIHTSFLQRVPLALRHHRAFLPLFPAAIESFRLDGYDLVVSSSHCVAKGVRVPKGTPHLSYVHAPMRYMWDLYEDYFGPGRAALPVRAAARAVRPWLRRWDRRTASRIDRLLANSAHVARKISQFYGREAKVVHPPVELERFTAPPLGDGGGGYFLWVGAFAPYKRLDLAIEAFSRTGRPLWIAGAGQEAARVRRALPPNIQVLGPVEDAALPGLYAKALALVFPGEEDFGLTPLEAQAAGRPVIALARGGALETVTSRTGIFFEDQSVAGLVGALERFDAWHANFRPEEARRWASQFGRDRFLQALRDEADQLVRAGSHASPSSR